MPFMSARSSLSIGAPFKEPLVVADLHHLPGSAAPLPVLPDEQPRVPETAVVWRAIRVLRGRHDAGENDAFANPMNFALRGTATAVGTARHAVQECLTFSRLACRSDDGKAFGQQRGQVFRPAGLFRQQDTPVQVSDFRFDAHYQTVLTMGMLLARVILIPYRFTCCDCQVNQRLPFVCSVPVPEAGGDEYPVSFTDLQARQTLKLNKAFPLRGQQHLFSGVIMPLGVRSMHKLHIQGSQVG